MTNIEKDKALFVFYVNKLEEIKNNKDSDEYKYYYLMCQKTLERIKENSKIKKEVIK